MFINVNSQPMYESNVCAELRAFLTKLSEFEGTKIRLRDIPGFDKNVQVNPDETGFDIAYDGSCIRLRLEMKQQLIQAYNVEWNDGVRKQSELPMAYGGYDSLIPADEGTGSKLLGAVKRAAHAWAESDIR